MTDEERVLWAHGNIECVLISCCAGAELQLRRVVERSAHIQPDFDILVRELYPTKSDLYERARDLESEWKSQVSAAAPRL